MTPLERLWRPQVNYQIEVLSEGLGKMHENCNLNYYPRLEECPHKSQLTKEATLLANWLKSEGWFIGRIGDAGDGGDGF